MAFPIPEHLPRKAVPQDVSTQILTKISEVTSKELTANLAASWVSELEDTIQQTKDRIHERIHAELPAFERQLASSKSVQTRLRDLSVNVDKLSDSLSNPETGLLPNILGTLSAHSNLAQKSSDADVLYEALESLARCNEGFVKVEELVHGGRLPEAVKESEALQKTVDEAPDALATADVMRDMKRHLRALVDRTQEQLSEAYSRGVRISPTELQICAAVQVRQSEQIISLSDILSSLSRDSLNAHLSSLRRDLVTHYIDFPLQQPVSSSSGPSKDTNGTPAQLFTLFPLPSHLDSFKSTVGYLRSLFDFLSANLFPALPPSVRESFPRQLCRPTVTAILRDVLVSHLPSTLTKLPSFLNLVEEAVHLERDYIIGVLGDDERGEREIRQWADNVPSHYGRKRRVLLLDAARTLIMSISPGNEQVFRVEVLDDPNVALQSEIIAVQGDVGEADENGWDFDDTETAETAEESLEFGKREERLATEFQQGPTKTEEVPEENGWDFDDDDAETAAEDLSSENPLPEEKAKLESRPPNTNGKDGNPEEDPSDAWGWDEPVDDEETLASEGNGTTSSPPSKANGNSHEISQAPKPEAPPPAARDESVWDDPWGDPASSEPPAPPSPPSPVKPIAPAKQPKVAKRLEKLSAKGKHPTSPSFSSSNPASPALASPVFPSNIPFSSSLAQHSPRPDSSFTASPSNLRQSQPLKPPRPANQPPPLKPSVKETFAVTSRAREIVNAVKNVLSEGKDVSRSTVFSHYLTSKSKDCSSHSSPTFLIFQTAPFVLDLYRALFPVSFSSQLNRAGRSMQFSNDCLFIGNEVEKLRFPEDTALEVKEQLHESTRRLKGLGGWWYEESIERVRASVLDILQRAQGFVDTGDQERFDECESVMSDVLRNVRSSAFEWKTVLPPTKYYRAAGAVVEAVLTKILADVLALFDIPELDSRKLSELCRILNALEGLFVDGPDASSVVVAYVPSWLKYSYLSELLEASIADISYLFDEGALIDFEVHELVNLVKALFADTPLRTNTIAKLQRGHPIPAS